VSAAALASAEPHLGPGALGALHIPDESIICPFTTPLAYASEAVLNGVTLLLSTEVYSAAHDGDEHVLHTSRGPIRSRWVINAAGLHADTVDRLFGHDGWRGRCSTTSCCRCRPAPPRACW
jgi:glycerol-3-phosphate dehydrogenase